MHIVLKKLYVRYSRYLDQGLYSLSTLLLSVLAPIFYSAKESAEILYWISFLLLFLAATTAVFVTQMLSAHDEKNEAIARIYNIFILVLVATFLMTALWQVFNGLKNPYFFYFSYVFCTIEFVRRLFIRQGMLTWSMGVSVACLLLMPTAYYISATIPISFWKAGFFLILMIALPVLYRSSRIFNHVTDYGYVYIKEFVKNGALALTSFALVWGATQGIFVIFYDSVESSVFVQQKLIFSILGFFNIFILVQENKYQPLYSAVVAAKDIARLRTYDKAVNLESHILFLICIGAFLVFYYAGVEFYMSFLVFSVCRYLLALSKKAVYYARASGNYIYLVTSNMLSLAILAGVYLAIGDGVPNEFIIPMYFLIHASVFLVAISFLRNRSIHAKYRNI